MPADREVNAQATQQAGPPCIMVIFGAAGDLTKRKLIPALYNLKHSNLLSDNFAVTHTHLRGKLGPSRRPFGPTQNQASVKDGATAKSALVDVGAARFWAVVPQGNFCPKHMPAWRAR